MWTSLIIAVLLVLGVVAHKASKTSECAKDAEEVIEAVLRVEGVKVDFSAEDDAKAAKELNKPQRQD